MIANAPSNVESKEVDLRCMSVSFDRNRFLVQERKFEKSN